MTSGDPLTNIQTKEYRETVNGRPFLRRFWHGDIAGSYERTVIWGSDEGLALLRMEGQIFVDATFRITPKPFSQCLVIMTHDPTTNTHVPCIWALMTSKNEYLYCSVLHEVVVLLNYKWNPKIVVCDFEKGLINAVKYEFSDSRIVGCYFHFQQAIFKKLRKYGISIEKASSICSEMKKLTLVNIYDIENELLKIKNQNIVNDLKWKEFYTYFVKTWLNRFSPSLWNVSGLNCDGFLSRTNNALERYNRRIGEKFANAHPNIYAFVDILKHEEDYFSNYCSSIRSGAIPFPISTNEFMV